MRFWLPFIWLTLLTLTACASPFAPDASPTPTIVPLDRSALAQATSSPAAESSSTATPIPLPSATPTPTPMVTPEPVEPAAAAAATLELEAGNSSGPAAMVEPAETAAQAEVVTTGLNVRTGPGMEYEVAGTVARGDILNITGASANGNWLQIASAEGDKQGWVVNQPNYIRISGSLDDLPPAEGASGGNSPAATSGPAAAPQTPTAAAQPSSNNSQPGSTGSAVGDRLVFATSSGGDLYVINSDSSGLRRLAGGVIDPVVSPDGEQVAYTRWDASEFGTLYVMNIDSGEERAILGETRQAKSPAWSPDGRQIIVSFQHGGLRDPDEECRRYDFGEEVRLPENARVTRITNIGDKDTLQICFIRNEDLQWGLRQVDLASGSYEDLPVDLYSFSPTWDPAQDWRVIYNTDKGLMQFDVNTGSLQALTSDPRDKAPVFSPDGQKLALSYRQHDHWELYTYDLASGARERLTKPPILADPQYSSAAPAWSPDGSQIAFVTDRSGRWEIWVMDADGGNQRPLFDPEVQAQLGLDYHGVNERLLNWIR